MVRASHASTMDRPEMLIWPPVVSTTGRSGTAAASSATWSGSDWAKKPVAMTTGRPRSRTASSTGRARRTG